MNLPNTLPPNLIPANLNAFIAGGYAACPELASDCDVWVTVHDSPPLAYSRLLLLDHLQREGFVFSEEDNVHTSEIGPDYDITSVTVRKVAKIVVTLAGREIPVHLLVTDGDVDSVMASFDISTHQCAITPKGSLEGRVYRGMDWTPLTEEPQVLRWTVPTPARLEKIRARYAHLRKRPNEVI